MRLPTQLLRNKKNVHKNTFGHDLILAGSPRMLGASALCGLSAMRSGAGLVTLGVPKSLNIALQKKISPVIMTLPLNETRDKTISLSAFRQLKGSLDKYNAIAIGPGLSTNKSTQKFILKIIENSKQPLVIDADALNALSSNLIVLKKTSTPKILTPHPGEMARLTSLSKKTISENRREVAKDFAKKYKCVLLLKGHNTIVASPSGKIYVNKSGDPGMATAGSGDVLTGIIVALERQGFEPYKAACLAAFIHGKAGELASKKFSRASMIATDIVENIPKVIKSLAR